MGMDSGRWEIDSSHLLMDSRSIERCSSYLKIDSSHLQSIYKQL